jgi:hypothetical protein
MVGLEGRQTLRRKPWTWVVPGRSDLGALLVSGDHGAPRAAGTANLSATEELAEEAAKMRLFPGIAYRGRPRRAWVIGSGLDVWELIDLLRSYDDDTGKLRASHPLVSDRHLRLARAYAERFPDADLLELNRRPLEELRGLYPFLA